MTRNAQAPVNDTSIGSIEYENGLPIRGTFSRPDGGSMVMDGTPREILTRRSELRAIGLDVPEGAKLAAKLREKGFDIPEGIYSMEDVCEAILRSFGKDGSAVC